MRSKLALERRVLAAAEEEMAGLDPAELLRDPKGYLRTFFAGRGARVVRNHAGEARKLGAGFVERVE